MLRQIVPRLPSGLIRAVGRAQFRWPLLHKALQLFMGGLTGAGTIRNGVGAGLRFDATGGQPGYLFGTSEPEEQAFLAQHLMPAGVFYDIGANVGFFSTIAAKLVGTAGQVYAFEPFPASAARASRNATRNGFTNVDVITAAVSKTPGRMTLNVSASSTTHHLAEGSGVEVKVIALDQWVTEEDARPPDVVLIDVEGAELDVLDGMRDTLAQHRPIVCCEIHWLGDRFLDYCRSDLAELGYTVTNLHGGALPTEKHRWHAVLSPTGSAQLWP